MKTAFGCRENYSEFIFVLAKKGIIGGS